MRKCKLILLISVIIILFILLLDKKIFNKTNNNVFVRDESKLSNIYVPTIYSYSQPFKVYDFRKKILNNIKDSNVKIIILGDVRNPGIYLVDNAVDNRTLINTANRYALDENKLYQGMTSNNIKIKIRKYSKNNDEIIVENSELESFFNEMPSDGNVYFILR